MDTLARYFDEESKVGEQPFFFHKYCVSGENPSGEFSGTI